MLLNGFEFLELIRTKGDFVVVSDRDNEENKHGYQIIDFIRSKEDDGIDDICDLFCCFLFEKFNNLLQVLGEVLQILNLNKFKIR